MFSGVLICESVPAGVDLSDTPISVTRIERREGAGTGGQPPDWTLLYFVVDEADATALAQRLSSVLDESGWYVDLQSDAEVFVVFKGRVLRYAKGDAAARAEAVAYAVLRGVPAPQADWES